MTTISEHVERIHARTLIVGGGPAGMMLGLLLARAGVEVVVLEKHTDFFRDFRGDTIHPSTLELLHELGLLEAFLKLPHQELRQLSAMVNGQPIHVADFSRLPTVCKFIALAPQWDFLNFIAAEARKYGNFQLRMETEATDLIFEGERIAGVRATTPRGQLEARADLTVAADGRHSIVRENAGLRVRDFGVPIDVLWMRIPKGADYTGRSLGYFHAGKLMIVLDRGDYLQCGYVIAKGKFDAIKAEGLEKLRDNMVALAPYLRETIGALNDWEQVKLLSVKIDRLECWYRDGLLCIGDAAHAMSPAGGVGINLAIQDAVAAANLLAAPLRKGPVGTELLARVQRRRQWPAAFYQRLQVIIHNRAFGPAASRQTSTAVPLPVKLLRHLPFLRRIIARVVGVGVRPEHVRTPEVHK